MTSEYASNNRWEFGQLLFHYGGVDASVEVVEQAPLVLLADEHGACSLGSLDEPQRLPDAVASKAEVEDRNIERRRLEGTTQGLEGRHPDDLAGDRLEVTKRHFGVVIIVLDEQYDRPAAHPHRRRW